MAGNSCFHYWLCITVLCFGGCLSHDRANKILGVVKKPEHILELRHMGIRTKVGIYSLLTTIHRVFTKTISRNFIFLWFGRHLREHFNKLEAADISEASLDKLTRGLDQSRAARMFYQVCGKWLSVPCREISNHSPHAYNCVHRFYFIFLICFFSSYANLQNLKGLIVHMCIIIVCKRIRSQQARSNHFAFTTTHHG